MPVSFRGIASLFKQTFQKWNDHDAQTLGASLAYYTVLSLAPLLIVAIAIAALVFSREAVTGQIYTQLGGLVGAGGAEVIQTVIKNAKSPFSGIVATIVGLITLLFGASGVFTALRTSLNRIWEIQPQTKSGFWSVLRAQFLSFGMVLGIGFLLLVSLVVSAGVAAADKWFGNYLPTGLMRIFSLAFSFVVITVLFALIYRVLPSTRVEWRDVWVGGAVTALLFTLGKFAIGAYLGHASVGSAYGAAGSLIVLLVWVYYSAQIFLFGAEFTHVYANERGSHRDSGPTSDRKQPEPA